MKYSILFFLIVSLQFTVHSQTDSIPFNSYLVLVENNTLKVENSTNDLIYQKDFYQPYAYTADLDEDQIDELIVVDSVYKNEKFAFTFYVYSSKAKFILVDSIDSGCFYPFVTFSEELNGLIVETGIPEFDKFNQVNVSWFLPLKLWRYENGELFSINEELYEPFMFENSNLIQLIEYNLSDKPRDCAASIMYKGLFASVFANYMNAGEQSLAAQLLKKYYLCDDVENFKNELMELIFPKAK